MVSDGAMLAIGAQSDCFPVEVYKKVNGGWAIHSNPNDYCGQDQRNLAAAAGFYHGYYISLSGNGERLVIGSIKYYETSDTVAEYDNADLVVQTYHWNETTEIWDMVEDKDGTLSTPRPLFLYENLEQSGRKNASPCLMMVLFFQ